ncbi:YmaF family protein [Paenibacillus contaminans]|uniref:YmaF family protein n=1 Tax=Paenibacillus contaminans TaxID=450362 RepID=UPI001EE14514|nr:YmaF family protein [Paenibacillus contaminans]
MPITKNIECIEAPSHAHYALVRSSAALGHWHWIGFFTYPVNGGDTDSHIHDFQGVSRVADYQGISHFHRFTGETGQAIPLSGGGHYHMFDAATDNEPFQFKGGAYKTVLSIPRHIHAFTGATGSGLGYDIAF